MGRGGQQLPRLGGGGVTFVDEVLYVLLFLGLLFIVMHNNIQPYINFYQR